MSALEATTCNFASRRATVLSAEDKSQRGGGRAGPRPGRSMVQSNGTVASGVRAGIQGIR